MKRDFLKLMGGVAAASIVGTPSVFAQANTTWKMAIPVAEKSWFGEIGRAHV